MKPPTREVAVINHALEETQRCAVYSALLDEPYYYAKKGVSIWQEINNPQECRRKFLWLSNEAQSPILKHLEQTLHIPESHPLQPLVRAILEITTADHSIIGKVGTDWVGLLIIPYIYERGARTVWHDDGEIYTGAFAYYTHPFWEANWGGELMYKHGPNEAISHLTPDGNRLTLIPAGVEHAVAPVSIGERNRHSLSGFFLKGDQKSVNMMVKSEDLNSALD